MKNHPNKTNQRHSIFQYLILPINPPILLSPLHIILTLTLQIIINNSNNLLFHLHHWLPQQISTAVNTFILLATATGTTNSEPLRMQTVRKRDDCRVW
ncbi:hypothetical protein HanRHA438_Chr16g0747831 [Helianthus annuus]|nr:hypothetical protein HanHA300_Chr16g0599631 [Helianthus annuus]KAJ0459535.1 hypothetical protein HanHA89_Chr16g0650081 [Helianthus annuus]KAJ0640041.1 hypothetical protein HanLR1_Chr16g0610721 [Helianthus annuus]KAJ0644000.1 hypothetical protein HanOQP8_Chr16g0606971 [Helianthus annuus]KAJ0834803.1 hypothetical protein HanRHA438_Chr16g0747831 [Helianthus annuus]